MYKISCEVVFDAAHRLLDYEGKCQNIHGHTYRAIVTLKGERLDSRSMLIDFGDVKGLVKTWIDENWDHAYIGRRDDNVLPIINTKGYCLDTNPTAEAMASYLYGVIKKCLVPIGIEMDSVRIYETPTNYAEYSESN